MSRLPSLLLTGVSAALAAAAGIAVFNASAQEQLDQAIGQPGPCDPFTFAASVNAESGLAQAFVPSMPRLTSVEVCITSNAPVTVDAIIREGTAAAPGPSLGGGRVAFPGNYAFVRVEFGAAVQVTPGEPHVIELSVPPGLTVTWLGMPFDQDLYAAGTSSSPDVVSDFAFRTYGEPSVAVTVSATRTPAPTATRTPTRTPTTAPPPTSTATIVAIATETPALPTAVPTSEHGDGPAETATRRAIGPPTASSSTPRPTPTRRSGVLGRSGERTAVREDDPVIMDDGEGGGPGWMVYALSAFGVIALAGGGTLAWSRWRRPPSLQVGAPPRSPDDPPVDG